MYVLISPGYRLRSVIFEFSIVFYSGCANLYSQQQCMKDPISPHTHQYLPVFLKNYLIAILVGVSNVSLRFQFAFL